MLESNRDAARARTHGPLTRPRIVTDLRRIYDALATIVAELEGHGDEELYELALDSSELAHRLLLALRGITP